MTVLHQQAFFYQGDTWAIEGVLNDDAGAALDLSHATAIDWVLKDATGNAVLTAALGSGISITDPVKGVVAIAVTATQSAELQPGDYRDQLRVTFPGTPPVVMTMWTGVVTVKKSLFV